MNTKPDDITLTQWMDGELEGEPLRRVETWAQEHPELLAERDAVHAMSANIREHIPDSIQPPYPDFFNQRILRTIHEDQMVASVKQPANTDKSSRGFWQWLAMPIAAGAMALCFYLGTQMNNTPISPGTSGAPQVATNPIPDSSVYTPDGSVKSDMFQTADSKAVVIVLEGLEAIPDDFEMAGGPTLEPSNSMMIKKDESQITF